MALIKWQCNGTPVVIKDTVNKQILQIEQKKAQRLRDHPEPLCNVRRQTYFRNTNDSQEYVCVNCLMIKAYYFVILRDHF